MTVLKSQLHEEYPPSIGKVALRHGSEGLACLGLYSSSNLIPLYHFIPLLPPLDNKEDIKSTSLTGFMRRK